MLERLRLLPKLYRAFGPGWLAFRLGYALRMRTGLLARQMPAYRWTDRPLASWLCEDVPAAPEAYANWRKGHGGRFFFDGGSAFPADVTHREATLAEADAVLAGNWRYFGHTRYRVGFPPDWHANPATGQRAPAEAHWSRIGDDEYGDIKLIWEASRFSVVYTLVRAYALNGDERYPAAYWQLVEDWARHNPPQTGPNWKCGQETTFRLMAWCFGLYGFAGSVHTSPQRIADIAVTIAAQAERIAANIAYARSQKNNHGISEAVGLWTVGLLFPEFKQAQRWREQGRTLLLEELRRQVYTDGAYVQHSFNYHRLILHDCLWALRLGELNNQRLPAEASWRFGQALTLLTALVDPESGAAPNYGHNDGALILPLNACDFGDYRPALQAGYYLLHHEHRFPPGLWDEDLLWLFGAEALQRSDATTPTPPAELNADIGGYYTLRGERSWAMVRCARYRDRPAHADPLHVDLWWHGVNVACDAGTHLYNGAPPWNNGLACTAVHNTVTVDGLDAMRRAGRFLWLDWAQGKVCRRLCSQNGQMELWEGEHDGYRRLRRPMSHRRGIVRLPGDFWLVYDTLRSAGAHDYRLHWLLPDFPHQWDEQRGHLGLETPAGGYHMQMLSLINKAVCMLVRADPQGIEGWRSSYYGDKEPALSLRMTMLNTAATFLTLFGPTAWEMRQDGSMLEIRSAGWEARLTAQANGAYRCSVRAGSDTLEFVIS